MYVTGWLKRGPTGIIGTNINDAKETLQTVLHDAKQGSLPRLDADNPLVGVDGVRSVVAKSRGHRTVEGDVVDGFVAFAMKPWNHEQHDKFLFILYVCRTSTIDDHVHGVLMLHPDRGGACNDANASTQVGIVGCA